MARVSVVIPVYNRPRQLVVAVESVLRQTFGSIEILIVDDGSTDGTPAVAEDLANRHSGIVRFLPIPRSGGPATPRNVGLEASEGELVAFLDSDDAWFPQKLDHQVRLMVSDPSLGLVSCNAIAERPGAGPSGPYLRYSRPFEGWLLHQLLLDNFIIISMALMKRDIVQKVGGFDPTHLLRSVADFDLWVRIASLAPIAYDPEPLGVYTDDVSQSLRGEESLREHFDAMLHIMDSLQQFLKQHKLWEQHRDAVAYKRFQLSYDQFHNCFRTGRYSSGIALATRLCLCYPAFVASMGFNAFRRRLGFITADQGRMELP